MALRRGFKAEANSIARAVRSELSLPFPAALNPWKLADHLAIPVITLSEMQELAPKAVHYFSQINSSEFSAVTVFEGTKRIIVYNDSHSLGRQASNISHELSHGILLHSPGAALNENGCRNWDENMENEADWLSGALLISEEAALSIARKEMSISDAAIFYGVSEKMIKWRLQITGAYARVTRTRRRYSK
jgi:Zn-dependent peptidase ImmA (M78 family)